MIERAHLLGKDDEKTLCGKSGSEWINRIIDARVDEVCPECLEVLRVKHRKTLQLKPLKLAPKDSSYICLIAKSGETEVAWWGFEHFKEKRCWNIRNIPGGAVRLESSLGSYKYRGWVRFSELFEFIRDRVTN